MNWEDYFHFWQATKGQPGPLASQHLESARRRVRENSSEDWLWLSDALHDSNRKTFVALVFQKQPVPKRLLKCFLQAAVLEENPSLNRYFVEPCVRSWGWIAVSQQLLEYLQKGSNTERAGAASAFYWVQGNPRNEDLAPIKQRIRSAMLREFVQNKCPHVRQRIIPMLNFDSALYPAEDHGFLLDAINIARSSGDEYIAHRIEVQLGNGGPFKPIPTVGSK